MKKSTIIILLLVLAGAVFFFFPSLLGKGGDLKTPFLSITNPAPEDTMRVPSDVPCQTVQQCLDYAKQIDPNAQDINAECETTCVFIVPKFPSVEVSP